MLQRTGPRLKRSNIEPVILLGSSWSPQMCFAMCSALFWRLGCSLLLVFRCHPARNPAFLEANRRKIFSPPAAGGLRPPNPQLKCVIFLYKSCGFVMVACGLARMRKCLSAVSSDTLTVELAPSLIFEITGHHVAPMSTRLLRALAEALLPLHFFAQRLLLVNLLQLLSHIGRRG